MNGPPPDSAPRRDGMVFIVVLILVSTLALLAVGVMSSVRIDLAVVNNHRRALEAFYHAEAGAQYVFSQAAADAKSGVLSLGTGPATVSYGPPTGFDFDPVTTIAPFARDHLYRYTVTGHSGPARAVIEVTMSKIDDTWAYAVFGHTRVQIYDNCYVEGYDGCTPFGPGPPPALAGAHIGSNVELDLSNFVTINGNVDQGESSGTSASLAYDANTTVSGILGNSVGPIDRDPLGMDGGDLAATLGSIRTSNQNAGAVPAIVGNEIDIDSAATVTLPAGRYYLTRLELDTFAQLLTTGPVEILVEGTLDVDNDAQLNPTGAPSDLRIYCTNGMSGAPASSVLNIRHRILMNGTLYAPWADIDFKQGSTLYGWLWGDRVKIHDSTRIWFDTCAAAGGSSATLVMESWRYVR